MTTITTTPCAIDMVGTINYQIQMIADLQRQVINLKKQLETYMKQDETDWENSMRASIRQSLQSRMKQDDEKHDSILHVSNWKHLIPAATEQDGEKYDWDDLDFGTIDDSRCGLCGCKSDNGLWDADDGDMLEDVICDDCGEDWRYDEDREAYVPK